MLRERADRESLWEAVLSAELRELQAELAKLRGEHWRRSGVGDACLVAEPGSLPRHRIEFVEAESTSIDAARRSAETSAGRIDADDLVVALGAAQALERFDGGRVAVLVAGAPYPCPPAPYECALHLDEYLRSRGLRERTELSVTTLQPMLMPTRVRTGSSRALVQRLRRIKRPCEPG